MCGGLGKMVCRRLVFICREGYKYDPRRKIGWPRVKKSIYR